MLTRKDPSPPYFRVSFEKPLQQLHETPGK